MQELLNFTNKQSGEVPKTSYVKLFVSDIEKPNYQLDRIKEVVHQVIVRDSNLSITDWENQLPKWFAQSMLSKSIEEITENPNLWHFESWVDAISQRAWKWYSSKCEKNTISIYLTIENFPYMIDPFIYILYAVGLTKIKVQEKL